MTIDEKNERIGAIDQIQNQYYMDKDLNSEQKDARGIITFLEKANIIYDWSIYCLLNSEADKSFLGQRAEDIYQEKITNMRNSIAKILGMEISELSNVKVFIDGIADDIIDIQLKTDDEQRACKIKVFSKMGKMYNDGILDDITCNMLLESVTELYDFYENKHKMPIKQYQMMVKSK